MANLLLDRMRRAGAADIVLATLTWSAALAVSTVFLWIVGQVVVNGLGQISWSFLTHEPLDAGRAGGVGPILVSTGLILLVTLAVSLPLGLGAAVLLAEFAAGDRGFGLLVRRSLDVLAGVPSIVFGLFGNALFCVYLGLGYSILSGGLTLACMALPLLIRSTEQGFRAIPQDTRRAAAALGLSRFSTVFRVLLPQATPALVVGLILGIGRALAETAALIFTSGYVMRPPGSLLDSGRALAVHVYALAMNVPGGEANAYASALVLIALLFVINAGAVWLAGKSLPGAAAR